MIDYNSFISSSSGTDSPLKTSVNEINRTFDFTKSTSVSIDRNLNAPFNDLLSHHSSTWQKYVQQKHCDSSSLEQVASDISSGMSVEVCKTTGRIYQIVDKNLDTYSPQSIHHSNKNTSSLKDVEKSQASLSLPTDTSHVVNKSPPSYELNVKEQYQRIDNLFKQLMKKHH